MQARRSGRRLLEAGLLREVLAVVRRIRAASGAMSGSAPGSISLPWPGSSSVARICIATSFPETWASRSWNHAKPMAEAPRTALSIAAITAVLTDSSERSASGAVVSISAPPAIAGG